MFRATDLRPRKFYATRQLVATYCGTSVEMIEQHYGKRLSDDMGRWLEHVTAKPVPDGAVAAQNP
ncbi:MAG TPA: hypothetical protein VMS22_22650 [Candidatus Eisenbacteria bacterium]|nr:hypothetical protein [Candidatus Eisenbacteria bacterium]